MATSSYILLLFLISTVSSLAAAASQLSMTPQDQQHADRIIEAMIGSGDFRDWAADFLSAVDDQFGIPLSATMFIPSDFDAADVSSSTGGSNSGRLSVAYHIVPQRLSFADLRLMKPLSRLPTLLRGNSIVVTNSSASCFTLDGVLVSEPDLFLSSSIAIHGVASSLDFSRYGELGNGDLGNGGDTTLADSLRPWSHRNRIRHRPEPESNTNQTSASSVSIAHFSSLFPLALALL
ncbi:unnamed protein product [Microthlaspi erraticum]|uniref:FAS1 domain-containing protein n=1 Tax=Microthlaspi erraticum TaxID=1685480 RepID=A0A6D2HF32_9BRAS|nr:unnamed protein product [Microthlaspi erraticum]